MELDILEGKEELVVPGIQVPRAQKDLLGPPDLADRQDELVHQVTLELLGHLDQEDQKVHEAQLATLVD